MKRITRVLLTLLLLSAFLVLPASANGPAPQPHFEVKLKNAPAEACYIDLFIEMTPDDVNYTDNRENFPDPSWGQLEVFSYRDNDYTSYTFHYRGAEGNIKIEDGKVVFFQRTDENLKRFQSVMIVVLDEKGNIMTISEPFDPDPSGLMIMNLGYAIYDYETDTVEVPNESQAGWMLSLLAVYLLISLAGVAVTVFVEWLIAHCFVSFLLYGKVIVWTNVITQLTMRILFIALYMLLWQSYWGLTILLEVAVYTAEYLVYCKRIPTAPKKTIFAYVAIANTVTLLLGLAVNHFLID